jgi:hypothetical protein
MKHNILQFGTSTMLSGVCIHGEQFFTII